MSIRFYNARLLTMEKDLSILEGGELWVRDGRVAYAGPPRPADRAFDREIDAGGDLLMPGFKNAHAHSAMTFLRSFADDLPLADWLNNQVFPMEAKLTGEDAYLLTKLANLEYLTGGITASYDMYLFPAQAARACAEMGVRTVLCSGLNDFCSSLEQVERDYKALNEFDPLVTYQLGFHAEYTTSREPMEKLAALAGRLRAPVSVHCSETAAEVAECRKRYGLTPPALFEALGLFEYGGTCYHCVHVTEEDMEILLRRKVSVVTNPGSNVKLASGTAPLTDFVAKGVNLAIGTDGPASNNCLDFFREMFLATGLQKLRLGDAAALDAGTVLRMATANGARAMFLPDCVSLAAGQKADVIRIGLRQPNMQPLNNPVKNLVYSGSKQNVRMTMVDGKILYEDGVFHVGCDPEEIYDRANAIVKRMRES